MSKEMFLKSELTDKHGKSIVVFSIDTVELLHLKVHLSVAEGYLSQMGRQVEVISPGILVYHRFSCTREESLACDHICD